MDVIIRDLRIAARALRRNLGFTAVAVLTLALGIGANTAIFSAVRAVLLRPLPYPAPDRLVRVYSFHNGDRWTASPPDYVDWRRDNGVFTDMAAFNDATLALSGEGDPEQVEAATVTASFFPVLGVAPVLGRGLHRRRRGAGPGPRGDAGPPGLATPLRRRSGGGRPHPPPRRGRLHRGGRPPRRLRLPPGRPALGALRLHRERPRHPARRPLPVDRRPPAAGGERRRGGDGDGRPRRPAGRRQPEEQHRLERHRGRDARGDGGCRATGAPRAAWAPSACCC